jgi:hypothetical protein
MEGKPALLFSLPIKVNNSSKTSFMMRRLYLEGTEGWDFPEPHRIAGERHEDAFMGGRVRPVIAKAHEYLSCKAVLVDAGGHHYQLGSVTFEPPPGGALSGEHTCVFCEKPVTSEDCFATMFQGWAHGSCIW